jgi:UDP-N-acetylglucosamine:LPS N-acetylglucosamine transferase
MLAGKAEKIFVAYPDMNKFFPAEKIVLTGIRFAAKSDWQMRNKSLGTCILWARSA